MKIRPLVGACLFLFLFGFWQLPLIGPDEPRYSQIARQMLDSGDWIVPHLSSYAWFEKPVLLYWLIAGSFWLFGVNEFAARLPSVLSALATVVFIYHTVSAVTDQKRGLVCAFVLATTCFMIGFAHAATFDMLLTLCVSAAFCFFIRFHQEPDRRNHLHLMYVAIGLGILAKGFVSLIIMGLGIGTYLILFKRQSIAAVKPATGVLIVIAIVSVWFIPVSFIYGARFWDEFFFQHHLLRYTSSHYHRSQGLFFYIPILIAGTYPWTLAPALGTKTMTSGEQIIRRIAWCWFVSTIIFFSLSRSKLPGYVLPAIPAFAIIAGLSVVQCVDQNAHRIRAVLFFAVLQLAMVITLFWGFRKYHITGNGMLAIMIAIAVFSVISAVLFMKRKLLAAAIAYVCVLPVGMFIFLYSIYPDLGLGDAKKLSAVLPAGEKMVPYNVYDFGPVFYTNGRMELTPEGYPYIITDYVQLHRFLARQRHAYVLVGNDELGWIKQPVFWRVNQVTTGQRLSLIALESPR